MSISKETFRMTTVTLVATALGGALAGYFAVNQMTEGAIGSTPAITEKPTAISSPVATTQVATAGVITSPSTAEIVAQRAAASPIDLPDLAAKPETVALPQSVEPDQIRPAGLVKSEPEVIHVSVPVLTVACVQEIAMFSERTRIYFGPNRTDLGNEEKIKALALARMVQACPEARIDVVGFADPKDDEQVSWNRARNVIKTLDTYGMETAQFTAVSHMQDNADRRTQSGIVDRRVEFRVSEVLVVE